jgi:hypothetical protein
MTRTIFNGMMSHANNNRETWLDTPPADRTSEPTAYSLGASVMSIR